jgi:phosphoribosylamine---glycine ligase
VRILLIGNGGREHALCSKLSESSRVEKIFTIPGNPGTAQVPKNTNIAISADDVSAQMVFASSEGIDLTVVGPEKPLSMGIVDRFRERGLKIFGPTQQAAQLESSKWFAKTIMKEAGVPTANAALFQNMDEAIKILPSLKFPIVLKADGLAAGKGVAICADTAEAESFFNSCTPPLLVEEFMEGEEASFFVISDGSNFLTLTTAQDHKRLLDGDQGPNTGGMGAYSPAPCVTSEIQREVESRIIRPLLAQMNARGTPFTGFLYAGLMLTRDGPKVVEFNVRFGDPEAQAVLPRLKSDLAMLLTSAVRGRLSETNVEWKDDHALTVVLASKGYPASPTTGEAVSGLSEAETKALVFHAGTKQDGNLIRTSGGRVFAVTGLAETLKEAKTKAYEAAEHIQYPGKIFRTDIGWRALWPK